MKVLFKFDKNIPKDATVIDTTSNSGQYRELSPFVLPAPPARNFENLWQFSKVYAPEHIDKDWNPNHAWYDWHKAGLADNRAHRYPMGKGRIPRYSMWNGEKLGYIEARKTIYAPEYAKNVLLTDAYKRLEELYQKHDDNLILLDYDAYDHQALGMTLKDVINKPNRKCGHAFVLMMMLTNVLEECIEGGEG